MNSLNTICIWDCAFMVFCVEVWCSHDTQM